MEQALSSPPLELKKIIRAGAGAGKTTTLVNELYRFYDDFRRLHHKLPKVVITTFTKKATQELKERLLKKAIEENNEDFFVYVNNKSLIHISTIHGVLHLVIKQSLNKLGLKSDLEIISEKEEYHIYKKILRNLLVNNEAYSELIQFYSISDLMIFCVEYFHLLSLEIQSRFYPQEKFALRVNSRINELLKKLDSSSSQLMNEKLSKSWLIWLETFKKMRSHHADNLDFIWIKEWLDSMGNKPRRAKESDVDLYSKQTDFILAIDELLLISQRGYLIKNLFVKYHTTISLLEILGKEFASEVRELKKKESGMTLKDIELLVLENLKVDPNIFDEFSEPWDFWMIDEYQDTSPLQEEILKSLIKSKANFLVGDPQQSIYLFRGARSEIFVNKFKEYEENAATLLLNKNYRSSAGVLDFINHFFSYEFNQFQTMEITKSISQQENDVEYFEVTEDVGTIKGALAQILTLVEKQVDLEDIVVLSRTNKELILLEKELKKTNVPYYYHSGGNFFHKREILDILIFIKFLFNPHDDVNFIGLLRTPWVGFSDSEIQNLKSHQRGKNSFFTYLYTANSEIRFVQLFNYLEDFSKKGLAETLLKFLFSSGLLVTSFHTDPSGQTESNIWKFLIWVDEIVNDESKDLLFEISQVLDSSMDEMELESESSALLEPKRVQLMTIHSSKGLQFKYVVLLSAERRPRSTHVKPFSYSEGQKEWTFILKNEEDDSNIYTPLAYDIKEEFSKRESQEFWRLLYVALTRAKEKIIILSPERPESQSWAEKIKKFYIDKIQLSKRENQASVFKFAFRKIGADDLTKVLQGIQEKKHQGYCSHLEVENLSKIFDSAGSGVHKFSFSLLKNRYEPKNSVSSLMKKEKGIAAHFQYERTLSHLTALSQLAPQIDWESLLKSGYKEFGFSYKVGEMLFAGSIDLWGFTKKDCFVIDYKTGDKVDTVSHLNQLKFYAQSLHYLNFIKKTFVINLIICYMSQKKVIQVPYELVDNETFFKQLKLNQL
ncbi:MAG: UvrD-helicase domain-containing protein [Deltaproteobacteria bacterium]|nr:UvrD-helicase domain-containing protein [Deltaproteobacteria bacterium]